MKVFVFRYNGLYGDGLVFAGEKERIQFCEDEEYSYLGEFDLQETFLLALDKDFKKTKLVEVVYYE